MISVKSRCLFHESQSCNKSFWEQEYLHLKVLMLIFYAKIRVYITLISSETDWLLLHRLFVYIWETHLCFPFSPASLTPFGGEPHQLKKSKLCLPYHLDCLHHLHVQDSLISPRSKHALYTSFGSTSHLAQWCTILWYSSPFVISSFSSSWYVSFKCDTPLLNAMHFVRLVTEEGRERKWIQSDQKWGMWTCIILMICSLSR